MPHVFGEGFRVKRLRTLCGDYEDFTLPVVSGYVVHDTREWQAEMVTCLACIAYCVPIYADGRCDCHAGSQCPLGRTGSKLRCTERELREMDIPTRRCT